MKACAICKKRQPDKEFNRRRSSKDGRQPHCRTCNRERSRKYYAENREHHKEVIRKQNIKRRRGNLHFVYDVLRNTRCKDCGETDPLVLDFDHVRGRKVKAVSKMAAEGYAQKRIQEEIKKCEVRCANCHRRKTARDHGWYSVAL